MREKIRELAAKLTLVDWILLVIFSGGMLVVGLALIRKAFAPPAALEYIAGSKTGATDNGKEMIWVDVAGAVVKPGVYQVAEGARVKDALVAAGGLSDQADREYTARVINLAELVKDGEKIYVPAMREKSLESRTKNSNLININTASLSELDSLWGVGESRAQAIIDNRPYRAVEELLTKKVLPKNIFDRDRDKLSVY